MEQRSFPFQVLYLNLNQIPSELSLSITSKLFLDTEHKMRRESFFSASSLTKTSTDSGVLD